MFDIVTLSFIVVQVVGGQHVTRLLIGVSDMTGEESVG